MDAGGLVSWNSDNGTITNSYAIGDVTSDGNNAGGVVGTSTRLIKKVSNSYSYESQEIEAKIVVFKFLADENTRS